MNFNLQGFKGAISRGGVESLNTNSVHWDALRLQLQFFFNMILICCIIIINSHLFV